MKNTFCLVVLGLFSFCHSDTAFGEATYENSGVVSFYGTYEYPTEESTTATSNSSTTTEPTKPLTEALHPSFLLAYMSRDKEDYRDRYHQSSTIYLFGNQPYHYRHIIY